MYLSRAYRSVLQNKSYNNLRTYVKKVKHPFVKTWDVISQEIPVLLGSKKQPIVYPEHVDIVVIGGGFIGSSVAYWLKSRTGEGISVVVLEKDLTYKEVKNNSSLGTLTQHFSLPENAYLSQYSADFLRNIKEHLGNHVDIEYQPCKNLVLACEEYAEKMEQNVKLQAEYGSKCNLLTSEDISQRYPWLNTHDIKLGCLGTESEGVFNPWAFLRGLVYKSQELGATYLEADVVGFELEQQRDVLMEGITPGTFERINKVVYRTSDNEEHSIKFAACILTAGDNSGNIARMAKVGTGEGLLTIPLPVEKRDYKVYSIAGKAKETGLNTPIISDTSGLWLQRNGLENNLLCGHVPLVTAETKNLTDEEYFLNVVKPSLLNRIPNCENAEIHQFSTEKQDCNTYDYTGIFGPHPYHNNLYIATGFGKQGCQHAPGLGRAVAELIIDSQYTTIDLSRFGFDRLLTNQPLVEFNIY